jgi:hypothetical protein
MFYVYSSGVHCLAFYSALQTILPTTVSFLYAQCVAKLNNSECAV